MVAAIWLVPCQAVHQHQPLIASGLQTWLSSAHQHFQSAAALRTKVLQELYCQTV